MNLRRTLLLIAALALPAAAADQASAQCGPGGYGYGYWDIGRLYSQLADDVPYFAAYPPVYYSYPVPRTYGYSPFAYPPGYSTPEAVAPPTPLSIDNPYFQGEAVQVSQESEAPIDQTTSVKPMEITNPFVTDGRSVLQAALPRKAM